MGDAHIGPEKDENLFQDQQNSWDLEPRTVVAPKRYNFVFANGQLEISPSFSHQDLAGHAGIQPQFTGPMAVGHVTLDQGKANWAIQSNMNAQAIAKELRQASKQYGWLWGGMTTIEGEPIGVGSEFAPVKAYVYKMSAFGPGYQADPMLCGNCGGRMGEPNQLGPNKWTQKCTNCGLTREIPQYHPYIKQIQEQSPYPDLLKDVDPGTRPWLLTASGEDHLYLAPSHLASRIAQPDGVIFVQDKTARATGVNERNLPALLEWAEDNGLVIVAQNDNVIKRIEDLDQHNTYSPEENQDEPRQYFPLDEQDKPTGQEWKCPFCHEQFDTFQNYLIHRRDEDSKLDPNDFYPDRGFPELDMDKPSPFEPKFTPMQRDVDTSYVSRVVHQGSYTGDAQRVDGFQTYSRVWGIDSSDHEHFVAYSEGVPVGFASVKPYGDTYWADMIRVSIPGRKIGKTLMHKLQKVYPELYSNGATSMGIDLMKKTGWVQLQDHLWKWAQGTDPKDIIPAPIPFIFDIKHDKLIMGHPGTQQQDIPGKFTPGGIVTGKYEPGGKVVITSTSNMPWTANHLMRLWYFTNPHMEIKSLHMEQEGGKNTRLAGQKESVWPWTTTIELPSSEEMAEGKQCYFHPDRPAVTAEGFAPMCESCANQYHNLPVYQVKQSGQDIGGYLQAMVNADSTARQAYQTLTNAGGHVYVVGGAVRDALMDKPPKDLDLMVTGLEPQQIQDALSTLPGKTNLTGKDFGVFRYWDKGHDVEIALPRRERSSGGGHKDFITQADPTMKPEEDLLRRDFTANAMAVDMNNGELIDPYGGLKDIKNKTLRTVRPEALAEDPLRVMRALVAASKHGLEPDDQTKEAMAKNAPSLSYLPQERIQAELRKIMMGSDPGRAIRLAADTGTLRYFLPEVADTVDHNQNNPHHEQDLFNHIVSVMERAKQKKPDDPDFVLAGLLHDIGKVPAHWTECKDCGWGGDGHYDVCPACGSENTAGHFYRNKELGVGQMHEDVGADMARARLKYLHYPNESIDRITALTQDHMWNPFSSEKGARKFLNQYGEHADDLMDLRWADQGGKTSYPGDPQENFNLDTQRQLVNMVRAKEQQGQAATSLKNLAVNGNDLIQAGIPAGPILGQVLQYLLSQTIENPELNTPDALIALAQQYVSQH